MQNTIFTTQKIENDIQRFAHQYPFQLDDFQKEAIEHLIEGESVLVTAPTGTGKTIVAEYAIWQALQDNKRVIYTTPLKALSNQKYQDFCRIYGGDRVGLMTGDIVEHRAASIVIMTTEVYRNILLEEDRAQHAHPERASSLQDVAFLIFDELHYLSDPQRGPVWEEAIICSPPHIQLVGLSATVSNAADLVDWISRVHGPISLVVHEQRAIPLEHYYLLDGQLRLVQDAQGQRVERFPQVGGEAKWQPGQRYPSSSRRWKAPASPSSTQQYEEREQKHQNGRVEFIDQSTQSRQTLRVAPSASQVLAALQERNLLPCLYFLPGRRLVEETALRTAEHCFTTPTEQQRIATQIAQWQEGLSPIDRQLPQVQHLAQLLPRGIGFHHAGLLPGLKMLVEQLFVQGYLRAVFATDTLALGVNMPARTVVVGSLSKFDGQQMRLLTPNEYRQLTGRAGRRGLDTRGAAVIPYSPWEPFEPSFARITGPQLPVTSSFEIRYNSVLNLWHPNEEEHVQDVCAASLNEYQRALSRQQREARRFERSASGRKSQKKQTRNTSRVRMTDLDYPNLSPRGDNELHGVLEVLRLFDFIGADDELTVKGQLLRQIFHPAGIILVELLMRGALTSCTPLELAEVCSWLIFERDRRLTNDFKLSKKLNALRENIWSITENIQTVEQELGLSLSPTMVADFHSLALSWANGMPLNTLVEHIDLAEGDVLMLLNQSIDLLKQVQAAVGSVLDNRVLWESTQRSSGQLRPSHRRRAEKRFIESHRVLTLLRPKLAQASASLLHGLVLQSRRLPSLALPDDGIGLEEGEEFSIVDEEQVYQEGLQANHFDDELDPVFVETNEGPVSTTSGQVEGQRL
jgi:superfamily II RNA helicase